MGKTHITGKAIFDGFDPRVKEVEGVTIAIYHRVGMGAGRSYMILDDWWVTSKGEVEFTLTLNDGDLDPRQVESDGDLGVRLRAIQPASGYPIEAPIVWDEDDPAEA